MELFIVMEDGPHHSMYRFNSASTAKAWIKKQRVENPDYEYYLYKRIGA